MEKDNFYRDLGNTGYKVSTLCFGVLTIGPRQRNLPLGEGAALLRYALELGVNFFDTAELYETYPYIREALKSWTKETVITTKSYAVTAAEMRKSLERARREMQLDTIPVFLLHEQESAASLRGHRGALEYLLEAKEKGLVGAVGLSTHTVAGVRAGASHPGLDVIHPLYNYKGWGMRDGTPEEMREAILYAIQMGKGVYLMKALAGGELAPEAEKALRAALGVPGVSAVAVGMQTREEIEFNLQVVKGLTPADDLKEKVRSQPRKVHFESWCRGCGRCIARCPFDALSMKDGKPVVDYNACMTCGYCSEACEVLAIKIW